MSNSSECALIQSKLLTELNNLRSDPQSYISILENDKTYFNNNILYRPNQQPIQTYEGISIYDEAISFLNSQSALNNKLQQSSHLNKAAKDLVNCIGPRGLVTHEDSDGNFVSERVDKYTEWSEYCSECIVLGARNAQDVVVDLIIDDGVQGREHRNSLFDERAKFVGVSSGYHKEYGIVTVVVFTGMLREKGTVYFDYSNYKYQYPESNKKKKIVNEYQVDDKDAPDNAISVTIEKSKKEYNGKTIIVTKKKYKLDNGSEHIVEVEEF
jgi:uncharacterized protein YkwD